MNSTLVDKTVLVVDDETAVREILSAYLSELNINVVAAESVGSAKEYLESSDVDVIISDIAMPGIESGIDLLSWCRERHIIAPFILISGFVTSDAVRFALSQGVQFVIHKPFSKKQIQEAVVSSFAIRDSYSNLVDRYIEEIERSNALFLSAVDGFAAAVGARDGYTLEHSKQVSKFAVMLAVKLGMDDKNIRIAKIAGELHDIGKIGVPERILMKEELLSRVEYKIMKTHSEKSAEILSPVPNLEEVVKVVRHHHEKFDGTGYPDGLAGEGIPFMSRLLAVCDAFSAMITERPYRPAIETEEARRELHLKKGTQFDPDLVEAFLDIPEIAFLQN